MKYKQLILVEFRNCSPFVYNMVSDKPITIEKVWDHFAVSGGINEDQDNLTFLDDVSDIKI